MSCQRQFHLHPDSIAPSQLFYQEANAFHPFLRVPLTEPGRKRGWLILHAEEERARCCLVLILGKTPIWDTALPVIFTPQLRSLSRSQCECNMSNSCASPTTQPDVLLPVPLLANDS